MKILNEHLNEHEVQRLSVGYQQLVTFMHQSELDAQLLIGILFKAALGLAVTANYDRDEILAVVAAVYDMERFMRPTSDEVH